MFGPLKLGPLSFLIVWDGLSLLWIGILRFLFLGPFAHVDFFDIWTFGPGARGDPLALDDRFLEHMSRLGNIGSPLLSSPAQRVGPKQSCPRRSIAVPTNSSGKQSFLRAWFAFRPFRPWFTFRPFRPWLVFGPWFTFRLLDQCACGSSQALPGPLWPEPPPVGCCFASCVGEVHYLIEGMVGRAFRWVAGALRSLAP